jgi:hypothetical protein
MSPRPLRFTLEKETRYPLWRRLCVAQGRSGRLRRTSHPKGFEPRNVKLVTSLYTDYANPAATRTLVSRYAMWVPTAVTIVVAVLGAMTLPNLTAGYAHNEYNMYVTPVGDPDTNNNLWTSTAPNLTSDRYWRQKV